VTGLRRPTEAEEWELVLVCDRCGTAERSVGLDVRDFGILWKTVRLHGWQGSPRPIGPHYCPLCLGNGTR
jgi:hypothetical protein